MWPANTSAPNATFLNYDDAFNVSNTGAVGINGCTGVCSANTDLRIRAFGNPTHVVVDVNGYYISAMSANVSATATIVRGNRAISATHPGTGLYTVKFDRDVSQCTYYAGTATEDAGINFGWAAVTNFGADPAAVYVKVFNTAGVAVDVGFQVLVVC